MTDKILKLISKDGATQIEGKFGKGSILFLESKHSGLTLSMEPSPGRITHAIFIGRRRGMSGIALRDSSFVGKGNFADNVKSGESLMVGLSRYSISVSPKRAPKTVPYLASFIALASLAGAVLFNFSFVRSGGDRQAPIKANGISGEAVMPDVSSYMREARRHVRAGDIAQARLSLKEAIEISPGDREARSLLDEIERGDRMDGVYDVQKPASDIGDDEALLLFREGQRLKKAGDMQDAQKAFNRANQIIKGKAVKPTFAVALENARKDFSESAIAKLAPRIAEIEKDLDLLREMDAREAIDKLVILSKEIEEIIASAPEDSNIAELKSRIDRSVKSTAGRWIAGALEAERLSGCTRALPLYREISKKMREIDLDTSVRADEGEKRCAM